MRNGPAVSVVVPTYMRERVLCDTLGDLLAQDYPTFEILVVDQTPRHDDETEAFLARHADRVRHIRIPTPSLPNARNVGVWNATGAIVVFIDDDVRIDGSFVRAHASAYRDPSISGVAGRITGPSPIDAPLDSHVVGRVTCRGDVVRNYASTNTMEVDVAPGGNMSFRRDVLVAVGGFDTSYGGTSNYEESDFSVRARLAGHRIVFEPMAQLVHLAHPSGGCGNRVPSFSRAFSQCHNSALFALRYLPPSCWPNALQWRARAMFFLARQQRDASPVFALAAGLMAAVSTYVRSLSAEGTDGRRLRHSAKGVLDVPSPHQVRRA